MAIQSVCGAIRDATFSVAHWIFAFKYFMSAMAMPALFGGAKLSTTAQWWLKCIDIGMIWQTALLPFAGYGLIWFSKYRQTCTPFSFLCGDGSQGIKKHTARFIYIVLSFWGGFLQILTAALLLFAMVKIRRILG